MVKALTFDKIEDGVMESVEISLDKKPLKKFLSIFLSQKSSLNNTIKCILETATRFMEYKRVVLLLTRKGESCAKGRYVI